eukprot:m.343376 g.343376  ORF g.343376 m.343376 type:complete len:452 (+) comp22729_c0_seq1:115-1470(+)
MLVLLFCALLPTVFGKCMIQPDVSGHVEILDNILSIPVEGFVNCSSLITINIHNKVTIIGDYAFRGCSNLRTINLPNNITAISERMFEHCSSLESITIPHSVTIIAGGAFEHCTKLASVNIPASVEVIHSYAFAQCTSIVNIKIPNSVTFISNSVFSGCTSLVDINIPNSVTRLGSHVFFSCTSLVSVNFPDSISRIDIYICYNCASLTSINIPHRITSIGRFAFYGCSSLVNIHIPNSVTSIERNAFDSTPCQDDHALTSPISLFSCQKVTHGGWIALMYTMEDLLDNLSQDLDSSVTAVEQRIGDIEQSSMQFSQEINKKVGDNSFKVKALHEWREQDIDPVIFEMQDNFLDLVQNITALESKGNEVEITRIVKQILNDIPQDTNYTEEINILTDEIHLLQANNTALQAQLDDTKNEMAQLAANFTRLVLIVEGLQKPCVCEEKHGCRP